MNSTIKVNYFPMLLNRPSFPIYMYTHIHRCGFQVIAYIFGESLTVAFFRKRVTEFYPGRRSDRLPYSDTGNVQKNIVLTSHQARILLTYTNFLDTIWKAYHEIAFSWQMKKCHLFPIFFPELIRTLRLYTQIIRCIRPGKEYSLSILLHSRFEAEKYTRTLGEREREGEKILISHLVTLSNASGNELARPRNTPATLSVRHKSHRIKQPIKLRLVKRREFPLKLVEWRRALRRR